ncbi:hypothetical protein PZT57_26795 [Pseudomonas aeruginosa]|uniref:hypothetical protein n=1 Tax=Pseudomonas aeruginosa TaxID=287 RepID=UPI002B278DEA|nr:hypothetical protein [Pseudomonas aeruginosa]MEA8592259.1 hypothetical protein [Pseudomonas aeruginosa]
MSNPENRSIGTSILPLRQFIQIKAHMCSCTGSPATDEDVEVFLSRNPDVTRRIVAFGEVSEEDLALIELRLRAEAGPSKEKSKEAKLAWWAIAGFFTRIAAIATVASYAVGFLTIGPLELVDALVKYFTGSNYLPDGCSGAEAIVLPCWMTFVFSRLVGALAWVLSFRGLIQFISRRIGVLEAGSEEAYEQALSLANKPQPVGSLVGVNNTKGSFLSSSESTIETTEGFHRVAGLAGGIKRGAPIYRLRNRLLIGDGADQKCFWILD